MNSDRTREFTRQRLEIEREIQQAEARRRYELDRPAREAAEQQAEHERRELKKRLLIDPFESHDFHPQTYDARFLDAAAITAAIQSAWDEFNQNHELDQQGKTTLTMFLQLHPDADITRTEVWEQALQYLENRLYPPVEVPPATVTKPTPEADPLVGLSGRARENKERELYRHSVLSETLANGVFSDTLQEMVDATGLCMPTRASLGFRQYMEARKIPMTREEIRIAAATYFDETSFLTAEEKDKISYRKRVSDCSSEDIKRAVGSANTYDPTGRGYRVGRQ